MVSKIIVPLDGSDVAEAVIPFVKEIASRSGAEVILMSAIQQVGVWDATLTVAALDREQTLAQAYLDSKAQELEQAGVKARSHLVTGPAADAIIDTAHDEKADLIAISTHGRSGISRWIFGSVAQKVVQHAGVPVLVIRASDKAPPKPSFEKILVPLDGSEVARGIIPYVTGLAKAMGSSIVLYHSVAPLTYPGFETSHPAAIGKVLDEMQDDAKRFLSAVAADVKEQGIEVKIAVSVDMAVDGVIRTADDLGAGLIAISTHGRSGIGRVILGSVADGVVRRSKLPCLVVTARDDGA